MKKPNTFLSKIRPIQMNSQTAQKIIIVFAILTIFVGIMVILGWIYDIDVLKSPHQSVTMMFSAAIGFVFSGITLYSLYEAKTGKTSVAEISLPVSGFIIFLLIVSSIVSAMTGSSIGIESILKENDSVIHTTILGVSPIPTTVNFFLILMAGFVMMSDVHKKTRIITIIGISIAVISIVALVGYAINWSPLFYFIPGISTGMALHTTILFVMLGVGIILLEKVKLEKREPVKTHTKLVSLFLTAAIVPVIFVSVFSYDIGLKNNPETFLIGNTAFIMLISSAILIFSFHTATSITKPLFKLRDIAKSISEGNLESSVSVDGTAELEDLSDDINSMRLSLREKINNLNQIMSTLDEASLVSIADEKGNITYANNEFCRISKYSREELLGQNHRMIKSGHHPTEFYQDMWNTITTGKVWKGEIKNKAKDGTYYWVKTVISPFFDDLNKAYKYISIRTDITEQKELQEKIAKTERLSSIGELSARLAHDLRNPLSVIKNTIGILKLQNPNLSQESGEYLKRLDRAIGRMTHQLDDVLDFVRQKPLVFTKTTLLQILNSTLEKILIPDTISLNLPQTDIEIIVDSDKLEVVFSNLISNAIQAMQNKGRIEILAIDEGDCIVIEVHDTGSGIPTHILPKIFDPLFTTRQVGTGLGLVSCKSIIEKHGGTIQVKTELGKGTTFIIRLPNLIEKKNVDFEFVKDINNGQHGAVCYSTKMQLEKMISKFVMRGMKNNCINIICVSKHEEHEWTEFLRKYVNVDEMINSGDLVIYSHEELYPEGISGSFDPISSRLVLAKDVVRNKNKSGLNIVGTVAGNLFLQERREDCINIEKHWHETISKFDIPITLLCPYSSQIAQIERRLRTCHDFVIV